MMMQRGIMKIPQKHSFMMLNVDLSFCFFSITRVSTCALSLNICASLQCNHPQCYSIDVSFSTLQIGVLLWQTAPCLNHILFTFLLFYKLIF